MGWGWEEDRRAGCTVGHEGSGDSVGMVEVKSMMREVRQMQVERDLEGARHYLAIQEFGVHHREYGPEVAKEGARGGGDAG